MIQELLDDELPAVKKASAARKTASVPAYADYAAVSSQSESSQEEEDNIEDKVVELPARLAVFAIMSYF